ncbi:hypothetical protein RclHR1_10800009 [Rhizophagus clarus]|uniref:Uncharacterized protein n=1 Tax=Rhizophagus clarus TaxID=94130 RepID=A0A2Z6Q742_9GLOM|nr:hypothetical protein RclHR1_10800009 [Rhizophagus clarus]GES80472.1 hypothetical protein RCL_jg10797.t1 [Rhizophagus clarus]
MKRELSDHSQDLNTAVLTYNHMTKNLSQADIREIDTFLQKAKVIFNVNANVNLNSLSHSSNFIDLKIGFHNINGLIVHPQKLDLLTIWYHDHNFDFMGIAETNTSCTTLQYWMNN